MMGHYDDKKAGPFGPKRRRVVAHLVNEALAWVREDGAPEHALPELFAEALTEVLERCGKLERPDGATAHPPAPPSIEAGRWYMCRCCGYVVRAIAPHATISETWCCRNPQTKVDGLYEMSDLEPAPEALAAAAAALEDGGQTGP